MGTLKVGAQVKLAGDFIDIFRPTSIVRVAMDALRGEITEHWHPDYFRVRWATGEYRTMMRNEIEATQ